MATVARIRWDDANGNSFLEYAILVGVVALLGLGAFTAFGAEASAGIDLAGSNLAYLGL